MVPDVAQQPTPKRFVVQLSHVDAGVYTELDLRVSQQPSETDQFLLTRVIAFCYLTRDDDNSHLAFSKGGIRTPDEPAISRTSLDGRLLTWCEIGNPSLERLHKAGKSGATVVLFTHHDAERVADDIRAGQVHRKDTLELYSLAPEFIEELVRASGERGASFELTVAEETLYAVCAGSSAISCPVRRLPIGA